MAKEVIVTLICDITGEKAEETVEFTLDGVAYEIDLTEEQATKLRGPVLGRFITAARKIGAPPRKTKTPSVAQQRRAATAQAKQADKARRDIIRNWAREKLGRANRGPLPPEIIDAWEKAGKPGAEQPETPPPAPPEQLAPQPQTSAPPTVTVTFSG
jgi:Lsr2